MAIKGRKGIFFMIMAILVLSIFLLSFTTLQINNRRVIQNRVETLNNFVFAAQDDLERKIFISGFRAIFLFEKKIAETGSYITNFDEKFEEAFYNGSFEGIQEDLLIGATFSDIEAFLQQRANKVNANLTLSSTSISIAQDDPWNVKVTFNSQFVVQDIGGLVEWNTSLETISYIPIEGFGDPVFVVNTNSLVTNNISQSPFIDFVNGSDVSNLLTHVINSYYIAHTDAPSFLDRLKGATSPNVHGIESLVNLDELASQGVPLSQKSVVDYIYFSNNNPNYCDEIQPSGMPSWFRIDDDHLSVYEVSCGP